MANVISGTKFLYFDTVTGAAVARPLHIIGIYWVSNGGSGLDIASGDSFLCRDTSDKTILSKRAEAAGDGLEVTFGFPGLHVVGFELPTMGGGVCHVLVAEDVLAV